MYADWQHSNIDDSDQTLHTRILCPCSAVHILLLLYPPSRMTELDTLL